jgi:hypothetical protein
MPALRRILLSALLALAAVPALAEDQVTSLLITCSQMTSNGYPADTVNWFYPSRHGQVVFFAHLLFPLASSSAPQPSTATAQAALPVGWHAPMALPTPTAQPTASGVRADFQPWVEASWVAPDESRIACYGVTLPAKNSKEFVHVDGRWYIPQTFAMAIGTRDLRPAAGQSALPEWKGLYHIDLRVQGQLCGVTFFSVLEGKVAPAPGMPKPLSGTAAVGTAATQAQDQAALQGVVQALQGQAGAAAGEGEVGGTGVGSLLNIFTQQGASPASQEAAKLKAKLKPGLTPEPTPLPTIPILPPPDLSPLRFPESSPSAPSSNPLE